MVFFFFVLPSHCETLLFSGLCCSRRMVYWLFPFSFQRQFDHWALLPFLGILGRVTVGGGLDLDHWSDVCLVTPAAGDWLVIPWVAAVGDWLEVRWVAAAGDWLAVRWVAGEGERQEQKSVHPDLKYQFYLCFGLTKCGLMLLELIQSWVKTFSKYCAKMFSL